MTEYKGKKSIEKELQCVFRYIRNLIENEVVAPGERLPAERKIAIESGVSRAKVRLALERMESYGVVMILPQSGSFLSNHSRPILAKQISNLEESKAYDFSSLVHVRSLLEVEAARLCAINRTPEELEAVKAALEDFINNAYTPLRDEKDMAFHSTIARCCHNPVIYSLLLMIGPDVLDYYHRLNACAMSPEGVIEEHKRIVEMISRGDPDGAEHEIRNHFIAITKFASERSEKIPMRL
ncbi:MAG: FadR family transcriptional regulator [Bacteroidales bacterium]|nr:FadR family transcriptional regulator [Bacteroidales bacterium]